VLPYRIAFQDDAGIAWDVFDFILDGLFWVDLLVNMFSSYYDDDNQLIKKRKIVFLQYFRSWFAIDLFCSLPIDSIMSLFVDSSS